MRQYIILSQADIITLRKNQPVSIYVNDVKYIMCSDECYEQERGSMSDTVKLIIEIPKPMYESIQNGTYCGTLYEELKSGVPLDSNSERAEVQAYFAGQTYGWEQGQEELIKNIKLSLVTDLSWEMFDEYGNETRLHKELWEILDNIGKENEE